MPGGSSLLPLKPHVAFTLLLCFNTPFLPLPIIHKFWFSSIQKIIVGQLCANLHTHRQGGVLGPGFEYPAASFASRRVSQNPGPRTPLVYVS